MKILVAGASGFIGSNLCQALRSAGHTVVPLSRHSRGGLKWDPVRGRLDQSELESVQAQAVINLAGESIAERWTARKKEQIYKSRIDGTKFLAAAIARLKDKPKVFLCASAIGYYGDRGDAILTEDSPPGEGFLAKVCTDWEAATAVAAAAGIRTINLRFGIVLGTDGGAFPRMLMPFTVGAGGRLGTGKQYMSWIATDDAIAAVQFLLFGDMSGPFNIVAPNPVTNQEFTQTLGAVLHKPTLMPVPVTMAHLAFGKEMADQVFFASARVVPQRLLDAGFQFRYPTLREAFTHVLAQQPQKAGNAG